jgi:hypothetical protein
MARASQKRGQKGLLRSSYHSVHHSWGDSGLGAWMAVPLAHVCPSPWSCPTLGALQAQPWARAQTPGAGPGELAPNAPLTGLISFSDVVSPC